MRSKLSMQCRYNKWTDTMKESNESMTDYFNLTHPQNSNEKMHMNMIHYTDKTGFLIFTFYYTITPKYKFPKFPHEINTRIYEYYKEDLIFQFKIDTGKNYPFSPPKWSLYSYKFNFDSLYSKVHTQYIVKAFCEGIINCHNCENATNWSPAISIHNDVLSFYMILKRFHTLIVKLKIKNAFNASSIQSTPIYYEQSSEQIQSSITNDYNYIYNIIVMSNNDHK